MNTDLPILNLNYNIYLTLHWRSRQDLRETWKHDKTAMGDDEAEAGGGGGEGVLVQVL